MTETMKLCGLEEAQVNAMIEDLTKTEGNLTLTMDARRSAFAGYL